MICLHNQYTIDVILYIQHRRNTTATTQNKDIKLRNHSILGENDILEAKEDICFSLSFSPAFVEFTSNQVLGSSPSPIRVVKW